jgi:hypothetical protein
VLTEALWAHKVSKYSATKVTPFELVFSQEVVLPVEVNLYAQWVAMHDTLSTQEYTTIMMDKFG